MQVVDPSYSGKMYNQTLNQNMLSASIDICQMYCGSQLSQHNQNTFSYLLYLQHMNIHQWRIGGNMILALGVFVATIVGRHVLQKSSAALLLPPKIMTNLLHHQQLSTNLF